MSLRQELDLIIQKDPAARSRLQVFFLYSGFHAVVWHRLAHWLYRHRRFFLARAVSQFSRFLTGIEIHPGARIGRGLLIDHGMGVVIGETAEVGDNCLLYQGVTLGGTGKDTGKRHPTLGDNVMVGSGAKVLGPIRIGNYAKIAAGAVVLDDIPDCATAVGVPARIVRVAGQKVDPQKVDQLDQVHMPDPVTQELCRLQRQVDLLAARVLELEKKETTV